MRETEILPGQAAAKRPLRIVVSAGPDAGATRLVDRAILVGSSELSELRLADPAVSRRHVKLEPVVGGLRIEDQASSNGVWLGPTRIEAAILAPGGEIRLGKETVLRVEIDRFGKPAEVVPSNIGESGFGGFLGNAPALGETFRLVRTACQSDAPVLIEGESGTGKELLAEAIHDKSKRADGPFVVVDCGAIPEGLVESELFGHERGAFTGATDARDGAFESARGGTLFLDEIGELSTSAQTRLLGVLQRNQFKRVGGTEMVAADVRIIAATNRNLEREVEDGRFRLDLFHRLAVVLVKIPPLRQRLEDLEPLARRFAQDAGRDSARMFDEATLEKLSRHAWPGNVRELRNYVERLALFGEAALYASSPPAPATGSGPLAFAPVLEAALGNMHYRQARAMVLDRFTELYVESMLDRHGGNVSRAAKHAGVARRHFHRLKRR